MKKAVTLLACACALLVAAASAAVAVSPSQADTTTTTTTSTAPRAKAAGSHLQASYRHWRRKLERYGVWHGRNLVRAARSDDRSPTARELRRSIRRMKRRFGHWSRTYEGRATVHRFKVRHIPRWGTLAPALDRVVRVAEQPARREFKRRVPRPLPVQLQHVACCGRIG